MQKAFTLVEMIVAITIFVLVMVVIFSIHSLSQKSYRLTEAVTEITQNGRVIFEKMTREIRQAKEIVTSLPDNQEYATDTILFQDGHDLSTIHYIHYFHDQNAVKREIIAYYFSGDPNTFVRWDAEPPEEEEKLATTTEEARIIGEYVSSLGFWDSPEINILASLEKLGQKIDFRTKIHGRNF